MYAGATPEAQLRTLIIALLATACSLEESERPPREVTDTPTLEVRSIPLGEAAEAALTLAPAWIRDDLAVAFLQHRPKKQDKLAALLLDLEDLRLIDEVAFTIAHLSPEVLADEDFHLELIVENAEWVYKVDPELQYVDIVEVGDPMVDDDFWSTTSYRTTLDGQPGTLELERDLYYWYVVHPRIEDERPYYIDAWAECGSNTLECPATPEEGMFWREFLWQGAGETCPDGNFCPVLSEALADHDLLWDELGGGDSGGVIRGIVDHMKASDEAAGRWFNFGAQGERSIQPNRIYGLGRGNCGEWADMTTAMSRTALIPNVNVTPSSWDHTWNGFWHERWVAWEPVNTWVDHPYGIDFAAYATRGDASTFLQTPDYNQSTFDMVVEVVDKKGVPVDAATVAIFSPWEDGGQTYWWPAGELATDDAGRATFPLVELNEYAFLVTSELGTYPAEDGTLTLGSSGIAAGGTDVQAAELDGRKMPSGADVTLGEAGGSAALTVAVTDTTGRSLAQSWRYGGDTTHQPAPSPLVDVLVMTEAQYALYESGESAEVVLAEAGEVAVDPQQTWVIVVDNAWVSATAAIGTLSVEVAPGPDATFEDSVSTDLRYRLLPGERAVLEVRP